MMSEETINIDGVQHDVDSMTDEQKYFISQIQDLQQRAAQLRFSMDQLTVAQDVFTQNLMSSLKKETEEAA
jgi:DNA-binding ferritin-like protein